MANINTLLEGHVTLKCECMDRIFLNGYIPQLQTGQQISLILEQFVLRNKPFLVFDWKRNYRDLLVKSEFQNLKVLTVGRAIAPFFFNPLIPPRGAEPEIFLKKLIEIMMHVYWLGDGVAYLLQQAIDDLYRQRGAYSGQCQEWPTLFDVRDWLRSYKAKGRESQWMDSARRAVETLCFGQIGRVLNTRSNVLLDQLLDAQAVLPSSVFIKNRNENTDRVYLRMKDDFNLESPAFVAFLEQAHKACPR